MEEEKSGGIKKFFNTAAHWILPCIFVHIGLFAIGFEPVLHATGELLGNMLDTFDWGQSFASATGLDITHSSHATADASHHSSTAWTGTETAYNDYMSHSDGFNHSSAGHTDHGTGIDHSGHDHSGFEEKLDAIPDASTPF